MTDMDELQQWIDSAWSNETTAENIIGQTRRNGGKIKKGSVTEQILLKWIVAGLEEAIERERRIIRRRRAAARKRLNARLRKSVKRPD